MINASHFKRLNDAALRLTQLLTRISQLTNQEIREDSRQRAFALFCYMISNGEKESRSVDEISDLVPETRCIFSEGAWYSIDAQEEFEANIEEISVIFQQNSRLADRYAQLFGLNSLSMKQLELINSTIASEVDNLSNEEVLFSTKVPKLLISLGVVTIMSLIIDLITNVVHGANDFLPPIVLFAAGLNLVYAVKTLESFDTQRVHIVLGYVLWVILIGAPYVTIPLMVSEFTIMTVIIMMIYWLVIQIVYYIRFKEFFGISQLLFSGTDDRGRLKASKI